MAAFWAQVPAFEYLRELFLAEDLSKISVFFELPASRLCGTLAGAGGCAVTRVCFSGLEHQSTYRLVGSFHLHFSCQGQERGPSPPAGLGLPLRGSLMFLRSVELFLFRMTAPKELEFFPNDRSTDSESERWGDVCIAPMAQLLGSEQACRRTWVAFSPFKDSVSADFDQIH